MAFSLMGIAASAAAAYLLRNKRNGSGQLFQNTDMKNGFQSNFNKPLASGLTEFAKEFTAGLNNMNEGSPKRSSNTTAASATNPESNELITQIGAMAKQEGNEQKADELANQQINKNL